MGRRLRREADEDANEPPGKLLPLWNQTLLFLVQTHRLILKCRFWQILDRILFLEGHGLFGNVCWPQRWVRARARHQRVVIDAASCLCVEGP